MIRAQSPEQRSWRFRKPGALVPLRQLRAVEIALRHHLLPPPQPATVMGDLLFPAVRGSCVVTVAARIYLTIDKKAAIPETARSAIGDTCWRKILPLRRC